MSRNSVHTRRERRTTFKKHSHNYRKVYHPYLPAILIFILAGFLFFASSLPARQVLNYSVNITNESLLEKTNTSRREAGAEELKLNNELARAAQAKANDMVNKNYWSHITPDGLQPWNFIEQVHYSYSVASENLAYGFTTSDDVIKGWLNSPAHAQAMLDKNVSEVGFGLVKANNFQNKGPTTVIVALYARPAAASSITETKYLPPTPEKISLAQTLTGGLAPWINFAAGVIIGLSIMYLVTHHGIRLIKRKLRQSEKFVIKHPAFDLTLLSLVILALVISRTAGFIH